MKLTFIGADHEVTGSCHLLEACGKKILVDYGMEQGINVFENAPLPYAPAEIDYVFVTHAHIDHTGLLPLLYKRGFRGKIYATSATAELCGIMLRDCAHIQESDCEWENRKRKRAGLDPVEPLYTLEDAEGALMLFRPCHYGALADISEGIRIRFIDVGHLLGSASIEVFLNEAGVERKIIFSGDIGNVNQPLIKDPTYPESADYVLMESTYGDRSHGPKPDYEKSLAAIITETYQRGGNVVIPCFAVGRTQEMLYFLRKIRAEKMAPGFEKMEVWLDSPLAIEATRIFDEQTRECFDEETLKLMDQGINPLTFPGLRFSVTSEESKRINEDPAPKVILSASGMCDAGRIRHHLKHNLWRADSTIVFAGYQAVGTVGRALLDGAKSVKLFGEEIEVAAKLTRIAGISGHADREGLLRWISAFKEKPKKVFIVHGEDLTADLFASTLRSRLGLDAEAPYSGSVFDLAAGKWEVRAAPKRIVRESKNTSRAGTVYARLVAAGQRLIAVIKQNEGLANKDLAKFADQIEALCNKWQR